MKDCEQSQLEYYMQECFNLAKLSLGRTSPNPIVGAIVLDERGVIVGKGFHEEAGKPHAEVAALKNAGSNSKNGTLIVNLEPCCHEGKTGPCTEAILKSGIKTVVFSNYDPNELVSGKGEKILKQAGVKVISQVLKNEGEQINKFFFKWIKHKIPYVTLKQAQTLDGKVCLSNGNSKWITSEESRREVHHLRNNYDAILVGAKTVLQDNPELTCRGVVDTRNPIRVVLDMNLETSPDANVYKDNAQVYLVTTDNMSIDKKYILNNSKLKIIRLPKDNQKYLSLQLLLQELGKEGILSVMVESGPSLASSFIKDNLLDEYLLFIAPRIFGHSNGLSTFNLETINEIDQSYTFEYVNYKATGNDLMLSLRPKKS